MAKIVLSEEAPSGKFRFSLGNAEIEKLPYETDDADVISNAEAHPWLAVEREVVKEAAEQGDPFPQTSREDDVLSSVNSVANDPDAVRAELDRRKAEAGVVAIESGLDQQEVVATESGVAETVAADRADDKAFDKAVNKAKKENE